MPAAAAADRYTGVAKTLHWLIAALLIANILLAWRMGGPRTPASYAVFQLHKSIGITVLLLTLVRIGWRVTHPAPPLSAHLKAWEKGLAHLAHYGFYALMLGLPLTGWLIVSSSATGIPTFLYNFIPWPHIPLSAGAKPLAHEVGETGHGLLAYAAYLLIAMHVAGALKHQWIDRDGEIGRMLPGPRASGPADWRLAALAAALVAVAVLARTYPWRAAPVTPASTAPVPAPAEPGSPERTPAPAPAAVPDAAPAPAPVAAPAAEAPPAAAPVQEAAQKPIGWIVDHKRSTLGFTAQWNGAAVAGRFTRWTADIAFDPDALDRSSVKASIDLASLSTDNGDAAGALPGSDFFDVASHPRATFAATAFKATGGGRYEARGTLTLRGVTKPMVVRFSPGISGDTAAMEGTATVPRTAFRVGQGEWAATDQIADAVAVTIAIRAKRAAQ
ncbi:MAG: YceI family protein [Sphingomonas fennica]